MSKNRRRVHVNADKKVAHVAQLMLLMCNPEYRDQCSCTKELRPCTSGKCYGKGEVVPPATEHVKARATSTLVYICLTCGQQTILSDLPDLDKLEEMPYEIQKLAILDYAEFKRRVNARSKVVKTSECTDNC